MDAGLVAVLVAIIAASAALIGSRLTSQATDRTLKHAAELERARWTREDARRHEDVRREAYPGFLATVDGAVHAVNAVLLGTAPAESLPGRTWRHEQRASLAVIEFVGSPLTIDSAVRLDRAVNRLVVGATGLVSMSGVEDDEGDVDDGVLIENGPAADVVHGDIAPDDFDGDTTPDFDVTDEDAVPEERSDEEAMAAAMRFVQGDPGDPTDPMTFLNILPYPLGDDPAPERMYGGEPFFQVSMARAELRVRRHEFVNTARADLGMRELDYPAEQAGAGPTVDHHSENRDFEHTASGSDPRTEE